jgi:hypothetical protein
VSDANKKITQTLGVDPVSADSSFDATDKSKPASPLALQLAAISKMANSADGQTKLGCTSAADTASTAAKVACAVKAIAVNKKLTDSSDAAANRDAFNTAVQAVKDDKQVAIAAPTARDPATAPVVTAPVQTAVDSAKQFFSTMRSNARAANSIVGDDTNSLKSTYDDIAKKLDVRTEPLTSSTMDAIKLSMWGAQLWKDTVVTQTRPFAGGAAYYGNFSNFNTSASCTFFSDDQYLVLATGLADAKYLGCSVRTYVTRAPYICTTLGEQCSTIWRMALRIVPDGSIADRYTILSRTQQLKYVLTAGNQSVEDVGARVTYGGQTATLTGLAGDNATTYASVVLVGELAPGYKQISAGTFCPAYAWPIGTSSGFTPPACTPTPETWGVIGNKHEVNLSMSLAGGGSGVDSVKTLSMAGMINLFKTPANSTTSQLESQIEIQSGSYFKWHSNANDVHVQDGTDEMSLKLKAGGLDGWFTGSLLATNAQKDKVGANYAPTKIVFNGTLLNSANAEYFSGTVTVQNTNYNKYNSALPYSATNFLEGLVSIAGKISIPSRPVIDVGVTMTVKNASPVSGSETATISGQYAQSGMTILMNGYFDGADKTKTTTTFSTSDGIQVVIKDGDTSVDVTKSGTKVAVFGVKTAKVTYVDGSYEQF